MKSLLSVLVFGCALFLGACGPKGPRPLTPAYTPTSRLELGAIPSSSSVLVIQPIEDQRSEKRFVGRSTEASPPRKLVSDAPKVLNLIGYAFTRELKAAGFQVAEEGTVEMTINVLEFWVHEDNTYNGTARFKVDIARSDAPPKSIVVTGSASRWGSSESTENYNEVLSDALVDAIGNLIKSPEFQRAIE